MEELIEETFPDETEETTIVTTVPVEETTTVIETTQTEASEEVPASFEYSSGDIQIFFESNDMRVLYERIQLDNETIIENQSDIITQLQEQNTHLAEMNTLLANFFFCFMVLMVCKFVHFLFYKVFFGGLT